MFIQDIGGNLLNLDYVTRLSIEKCEQNEAVYGLAAFIVREAKPVFLDMGLSFGEACNLIDRIADRMVEAGVAIRASVNEEIDPTIDNLNTLLMAKGVKTLEFRRKRAGASI